MTINMTKYGLLSLVASLLLFLPVKGLAGPLDNWHQRSVSGLSSTQPAECLAYGNGIFVGIGSDIITSLDGVTWTLRASRTTNRLHGIAYGKDLFVAVGSGGSVATSSDGVTWTSRLSGTEVDYYAAAYGNGTFVAVGESGAVMTSPDGIEWSSRASATSERLYGVAYGNSMFVAVGYNGAIVTSPDGLKWTKIPMQTNYELHGILFSNGIFVAVEHFGNVVISSDGLTWTKIATGGDFLQSVTYGYGTFVAVGYYGTIVTSPDAITWKKRDSGTISGIVTVAYGNNTFVVGTYDSLRQSDPFITLSAGWNLVSLPREPPDTRISAVLSDISSDVRIVWGYDNQTKSWRNYRPSATKNELSALEAAKGYWLYMNTPGVINMSGWAPPSPGIHLYEGWNLTGYFESDTKKTSAALGSILNSCRAIWGWNQGIWNVKVIDASLAVNLPELVYLEKGKGYWIMLKAGHNGEWNQDTTSPNVPTGLTASADRFTAINLSWDGSSDNVGVSGYRIYRDGNLIKSITGASFTDTGLSAGRQYCYSVSSYDKAGNESTQSSPVCATTDTPTDVPVISNLRFSPKSARLGEGGGSVIVTGYADFVDASGNLASVRLSSGLYLDLTVPLEEAGGLTSGTLMGAFMIPTLQAGSYAFEVWVVDTAGNSSNRLSGVFYVDTDTAGTYTGSLDGAFGTEGVSVYESPVDWHNEEGRAIAMQPDGRIVVAGYTFNGLNNDVLLLRYNIDGSLDPAFGNDGVVIYDSSFADEAYGIAIQPDGKIVVAGYTRGRNNEPEDMLVLRYNADGTPDQTFGTSGVVSTNVEVYDYGYAVALQPDGKIVVAGKTSTPADQFALLLRYMADGTLDHTFGTEGIVKHGGEAGGWDTAYAVAVQADGKIVATGDTSAGDTLVLTDLLVLRYNNNGTPDVAFGAEGVVTYHNHCASGRAIAVQSDGKIAVAGGIWDYASINNAALVLRYNNDGTLDNTFGSEGVFTYNRGESEYLYLNGIALQQDGKILVTGYLSGYDGYNVLVLRFLGNGLLDPTFSQDGVGKYSSGGNAHGYAAAVQPDGRIAVTGASSYHDNYSDFAVLTLTINK